MEKSDNPGIDNNENNDINISSNNNGNNEIIPVNYDISSYNPREFNNSNQIGFCGTFTNLDQVQQMQNQINQIQLSQMQYQMNNMQQQLYNKNNRSDKMEMENLTENIAKSIINSKKESMNLKENRDLNFTTIQSNNNQLNNIPMIDRNLLYENNNNNYNNYNDFLRNIPESEQDYIDISNALNRDIDNRKLFFLPNAYTNITNEIAKSYNPYQYFEAYMTDRGDKPNILYKFIRDLRNCNMFNDNYLNSNLIYIIDSIDQGAKNENIYELIAILSLQLRDYKSTHNNNIKKEDVIKVIKIFNNYTIQYLQYLKIKEDLENNIMANDDILNQMKKVVRDFFQKSPKIYQSVNNLTFISNAITSNSKINNLLIERVNDIIININGLMTNTNLNLDHLNDLERRISALVRDINLNQNNNNKNFRDIITSYDLINKDIANLQTILNFTSQENIDTKKIKEALDYLGGCLSQFNEFKSYKTQDIRNNALILINDLLNDLLNENAQISDNEKEVKDKIKKIIDNLNTLSKEYVNQYYEEILIKTLKDLKDGIESSKKESLESITSINDKLDKLDKFNEIFKEESDGIKDDITKLKKENEDLKKTNECIIELIKDNIPNVKDKLEKRLQEIREDKLEKRRHEIREENTRKRMERLQKNRNEIISKDDNNPPLDFNSNKPDCDVNDVYKNSSITEMIRNNPVGIVIDENTIEAVKDDSQTIINDSLDSIIEKIDKISKEEVAYKELNGNNVDLLRVKDFWKEVYDLYESHKGMINSNDQVNKKFVNLFLNFIAILKSYNGEYYKELSEKYKESDCSIETFNNELNLNLFK